MDLATELSQARERRDLSLAEIARRTKISVATLRAIESGHLEELPGGILTRGFLRAFAREVGCDPEAIVRQYRETFEEQERGAEPTVDKLMAAITTPCYGGRVHVADIDAMDRRRSRTAWIAAVVLTGGIGSFLFIHREHPSRLFAPPAVNAVSVLPASVNTPSSRAESGTVGVLNNEPSADRPASGPGSELRLDIQLQGECWVTATADKQRVIYREMSAGEHTQIEARDEVLLRIGDPSNLKLAINGGAARPLGASGQPVTLRITRQNYQEFLDR